MTNLCEFLKGCGNVLMIFMLGSMACSSAVFAAKPSFINFESSPVRPIAKSVGRLLVTNIPDARLEVYKVSPTGQIEFDGSVAVGLEPVSVAFRHKNEAWVVNHLSDSISIIDLRSKPYRIKRTLLVGDEPRDIVFAKGKAFITTAHRGQHRSHASLVDVPGAGDPQLHTPGIPRADVWVFDPRRLGRELGGKPLRIIELFGDTPRGLTVSPDGNTVYVAVFHSGNQTSVLHEAVVCYGFDDDGPYEYYQGQYPCQVQDEITAPGGMANGMLPGGRPGPGKNKEGEPQPWTGVIVKYDQKSGEWLDAKSRNFSNAVRFSLPDKDVFAINVNTLTETKVFKHVGTTLFNMVTNPVSGKVYISNTDAQNHIRFEGPGQHGGSTVQGNIARAQITVIDPSDNTVKPRHLNKHINYNQLKAPNRIKQASISYPTELGISSDGQWLFVAATGSGKIAIYDTAQLENDSLWDNSGTEFNPIAAAQNHIETSDGPMGLLVDEHHSQLYVLTRFNNSVAIYDINTGNLKQSVAMHNPEPAKVVAGRSMLYDAKRSSSNGESSCASCHIAGDADQLAWNLGNPDAGNTSNPQPFPTRNMVTLGCDLVGPNEPSCQLTQIINGNGDLDTFASMKGPMTTQTLRGMSTHGHLHWRGDRSNGYFGKDLSQTLDEKTSFKNFIVAFEGLLGLDVNLPESVNATNKSFKVRQLERDVDKFAEFALSIQLPPNPIRGLDNQLSSSAQKGSDFFAGPRRADGAESDVAFNGPEKDGQTCEGCHGLDPAKGYYGTRGEAAHGGESMILKVPHLRNMYQKVGMFGLPDREGFRPSITKEYQGDQVRGFGFLHDGATDLLFNFLGGGVFDNGEVTCAEEGLDPSKHGCDFNFGHIGIPDDEIRQGLVDYLMQFETDLASVVGQQITIQRNLRTSEMFKRWRLLERRANTVFVSKTLGGVVKECDLIANGVINGEQTSYVYYPSSKRYKPATRSKPAVSKRTLSHQLRKIGNTLTFTCVPPGSGHRMGLDRDSDGVFNNDEV